MAQGHRKNSGPNHHTTHGADKRETAIKKALAKLPAGEREKILSELDKTVGKKMRLFKALCLKHPSLEIHSHNVASLSLLILKKLKEKVENRKIIGTPALEISSLTTGVLREGAMFHDIGKIHFSRKMLENPLLNVHQEGMRHKHPERGAVLSRGLLEKDSEIIIRSHHENHGGDHLESPTGKGYPGNLSGEKIPLGARIVRVADSYCAMAEGRTNKRERSQRDIVKEISSLKNKSYDPLIVEAFEEAVKEFNIRKINGK